MARSEVSVSVYCDGASVIARGGTRRERGSAIGAVVRGKGWALRSISYSESFGWQAGTYARYSVKEA